MKTEERVALWKQPPFSDSVIAAVEQLEQDPKALEDAFYQDIDFGTGGMRGVMGVGSNRINEYTLGRASQGLANYLHQKYKAEKKKIVIAYDSRHNSQSFAQKVADVFTANGIHCYLFSSLRATPLLSFAVRHLEAHAGIVLTASHNPPEYNGYKVYNQFGGQIVPPEDKDIINSIQAVAFSDILWEGNQELLNRIDEEVDSAYYKTITERSVRFGKKDKNTRIVFSPLHGTSTISLPTLLKNAGYEQVFRVEEQATPDGNFPTVASPNPEEKAAFEMALKKAQEVDADLVMATDPDADRIGVGVKDKSNNWMLLNGNQLMVLLTRFVLEQTPLEENDFIASTIVSTPLLKKIADDNKVDFYLTLTGFKWIGDLIQKKKNNRFLCGGEESYGYLFGSDVRDKDALSTALLACDLQSHLAAQKQTIYDYLLSTYIAYGCYHEGLFSLVKKGKEGKEEIDQIMQQLRNNPPTEVAGIPVVQTNDFLLGKTTKRNEPAAPLEFQKANVFQFVLEDGSVISVRPSGTEPKIKFYFSVNAPLKSAEEYPNVQDQLNQKIEEFKGAIYDLF